MLRIRKIAEVNKNRLAAGLTDRTASPREAGWCFRGWRSCLQNTGQKHRDKSEQKRRKTEGRGRLISRFSGIRQQPLSERASDSGEGKSELQK